MGTYFAAKETAITRVAERLSAYREQFCYMLLLGLGISETPESHGTSSNVEI
jgi:hypothetical protein